MATLEQLEALLMRLSRYAAYAGGAGLLIVAGLVVFEIFARRMLGFAITGVDEISGFAYAVAMAWGFAFTLFDRAHIRVDVVYVRLPRVVQRVLDVVAILGLLGLMAFLSLRALALLRKSVRLDAVSNSPLQVPMWIPQSLWFAGLAFFVLCLFVLALRATIALLRGRLDIVEAIAHAPDVTRPLAADDEEALADRARGIG